MTTNLIFPWLVLPSVLFTLWYFPALKRSLVLVSPYPKANPRKRVLAAAIDALVVAACLVAYWKAGSLPYAVAAILYLACRDAIGGQSFGKLLVGQVVVHPDGQRCGVTGSCARNLFFVLPGANLVAAILEARTLARDPQGQRLGDRVAHTQVIDGLGARDVVADIQRWWASFVTEVPGAAGRPDRVRPSPVE